MKRKEWSTQDDLELDLILKDVAAFIDGLSDFIEQMVSVPRVTREDIDDPSDNILYLLAEANDGREEVAQRRRECVNQIRMLREFIDIATQTYGKVVIEIKLKPLMTYIQTLREYKEELIRIIEDFNFAKEVLQSIQAAKNARLRNGF